MQCTPLLSKLAMIRKEGRSFSSGFNQPFKVWSTFLLLRECLFKALPDKHDVCTSMCSL